MEIRNASSAALEIAATGQIVEAGGTAEVDDVLGDALCEQADVWQSSKNAKPAPGGKSKED